MLSAQQTFLTHQITSVILMLRAFYDIPSIHQAEMGQIFLTTKFFKDVERFVLV